MRIFARMEQVFFGAGIDCTHIIDENSTETERVFVFSKNNLTGDPSGNQTRKVLKTLCGRKINFVTYEELEKPSLKGVTCKVCLKKWKKLQGDE